MDDYLTEFIYEVVSEEKPPVAQTIVYSLARADGYTNIEVAQAIQSLIDQRAVDVDYQTDTIWTLDKDGNPVL